MVEIGGFERESLQERCRDRGYHQTQDIYVSEWGSRKCIDCHVDFGKDEKYVFTNEAVEMSE